MNFKEFFLQFPDDDACKKHFKAYRDKEGVICKKCGCKHHYWLSTISYYKCKNCGFRTSLKSGTVMENSKLSFSQWYMAFQFATSTKKSFSALEIQKQIGHKFYEPIWFMMHKIRIIMGKRDSIYKLENEVEMDEAFIVTTVPHEKDQFGSRLPKKRMRPGKGSPRTATVLVMAESTKVKYTNRNKSSRAVGFIKMIQIEDWKAKTILPQVSKSVNPNAHILTDGANHYCNLNTVVKSHAPHVMTFKQAHNVLPWVHKSISNAKRIILGIHHSIGKAYTQNYLNEFCYKFNRRGNEFELFDRIINVGTIYQWNN